jgi:alpha-1,3-rhamnosyl/mannosyltransferase
MAHLFVYPSIYEGFGLPILEAQACGTPVLCSQRTSMPKVGGNVAAYFDPKDEESIAQCLKEGLERSDYEAWCSQSMENTWRFSWRTAAEGMIVAVQTENAPEA